jgi:hypothetical protein
MSTFLRSITEMYPRIRWELEHTLGNTDLGDLRWYRYVNVGNV